MKKHTFLQQQGFTLIEISIVLVIVGLLLGGVLKGRELIENAKMKRVSNDFNGIAAAVYSYLDRYSAIPGDDSRAAARWPANTNGVTDAATAGDNSGIIDTGEELEVWDHLRRSSLLGGASGTTKPLHAFGGPISIGNGLLGHAGPAICMEGITGNVAEIIDIQADDGSPVTGIFRAILNSETVGTDTPTATTAGNGGKYNASSISYHLCKQL